MTPRRGSVIWLPVSSQTTTVEWYLSEGKATGVENMREEWEAVPLDRPESGFVVPCDPR